MGAETWAGEDSYFEFGRMEDGIEAEARAGRDRGERGGLSCCSMSNGSDFSGSLFMVFFSQTTFLLLE